MNIVIYARVNKACEPRDGFGGFETNKQTKNFVRSSNFLPRSLLHYILAHIIKYSNETV